MNNELQLHKRKLLLHNQMQKVALSHRENLNSEKESSFSLGGLLPDGFALVIASLICTKHQYIQIPTYREYSKSASHLKNSFV